MHRRINLSVRFKLPDYSARQDIWQTHFPKSLKHDGTIDWKSLALKYELTGGLIKNGISFFLSFSFPFLFFKKKTKIIFLAIISALSIAIGKTSVGEEICVSQVDLEEGAKMVFFYFL